MTIVIVSIVGGLAIVCAIVAGVPWPSLGSPCGTANGWPASAWVLIPTDRKLSLACPWTARPLRMLRQRLGSIRRLRDRTRLARVEACREGIDRSGDRASDVARRLCDILRPALEGPIFGRYPCRGVAAGSPWPRDLCDSSVGRPGIPACRRLRGTPIMFSILAGFCPSVCRVNWKNLAARCLSLSADTV